MFGCDGVFSAVRRFSSNVHFIEHCYIEFTLPANAPDADADADLDFGSAYREELALTGGRLPASRVRARARASLLCIG